MTDNTVIIEYYNKGGMWFGFLSEEDKNKYPQVKGLIIVNRSLDILTRSIPSELNKLLLAQGLNAKPWSFKIREFDGGGKI